MTGGCNPALKKFCYWGNYTLLPLSFLYQSAFPPFVESAVSLPYARPLIYMLRFSCFFRPAYRSKYGSFSGYGSFHKTTHHLGCVRNLPKSLSHTWPSASVQKMIHFDSWDHTFLLSTLFYSPLCVSFLQLWMRLRTSVKPQLALLTDFSLSWIPQLFHRQLPSIPFFVLPKPKLLRVRLSCYTTWQLNPLTTSFCHFGTHNAWRISEKALVLQIWITLLLKKGCCCVEIDVRKLQNEDAFVITHDHTMRSCMKLENAPKASSESTLAIGKFFTVIISPHNPDLEKQRAASYLICWLFMDPSRSSFKNVMQDYRSHFLMRSMYKSSSHLQTSPTWFFLLKVIAFVWSANSWIFLRSEHHSPFLSFACSTVLPICRQLSAF